MKYDFSTFAPIYWRMDISDFLSMYILCLLSVFRMNIKIVCAFKAEGVFLKLSLQNGRPRGATPILGHIRDVRPEWVSFPGRKPADGCKFFTKNLRMGHNFDIILPGNGWFSSKLNKTYCSLVNFYCK